MNKQYPSYEVSRAVEIKKIVSFFCQKNRPGFVYKGETHDFWEIAVVLGGKAVICAGDNVFRLEKGQAILHRPNEFHSISTEGEEVLYLGVFSFYGNVLENVNGRVYPVKDEFLDMFIKLRLQAGSIFEFYGINGERTILVKNLKDGKILEQQVFISRMEYLLASILAGGKRMHSVSDRHTSSEKNYLRIVDVITKNISKRLSIEEIAKLCNMSVSNAKKVFSKYAGCGISAYYNGLIIFEAKKALSDGIGVSEVAKRLGFSSQNYFSSFFKRITGVTPSEWKSKHLTNQGV